jgi:hypothetical protein
MPPRMPPPRIPAATAHSAPTHAATAHAAPAHAATAHAAAAHAATAHAAAAHAATTHAAAAHAATTHAAAAHAAGAASSGARRAGRPRSARSPRSGCRSPLRLFNCYGDRAKRANEIRLAVARLVQQVHGSLAEPHAREFSLDGPTAGCGEANEDTQTDAGPECFSHPEDLLTLPREHAPVSHRTRRQSSTKLRPVSTPKGTHVPSAC